MHEELPSNRSKVSKIHDPDVYIHSVTLVVLRITNQCLRLSRQVYALLQRQSEI